MKNSKVLWLGIFSLILIFSLSACGGGGGGNNSPAPGTNSGGGGKAPDPPPANANVTVSGQVKSHLGVLVPGATIVATLPNGSTVNGSSDGNGNYSLSFHLDSAGVVSFKASLGGSSGGTALSIAPGDNKNLNLLCG
jgi:hypothetical protein